MYLEFNLPWRADTISWWCPPLGLARGSSCKSKVLSTSRPVLGVSIITYKSLVPVPQKQGCHLRFCWKKHVSSVGLEETGMGRQKRSFETTVVIICIVFYVLIFLCILYIYINMFSFTATSVEKGLGSEKLNNLPQVSQGLDGSTGTWRQALCPHSPTAMPCVCYQVCLPRNLGYLPVGRVCQTGMVLSLEDRDVSWLPLHPFSWTHSIWKFQSLYSHMDRGSPLSSS